MKRYGSIIGIKEEKIEEYKKLHAEIWPEILKITHDANIRNYTIYLYKLPTDEYYLFSYFEYIGDDFAADCAKLDSYPIMKKWLEVCKPCHKPLPNRATGEWWANMEEIFHCD